MTEGPGLEELTGVLPLEPDGLFLPIYRTWLAHPEYDAPAIAASLRVDPVRVSTQITDLVDSGLGVQDRAKGSGWRPLWPEQAAARQLTRVEAETAQRRTELAAQRAEVRAMTPLRELAAGTRRPTTTAGVEVLAPAEIRDRMLAESTATRREIRSLVTAPLQPAGVRGDDVLQPDLQARGVTVRCVWTPEPLASNAVTSFDALARSDSFRRAATLPMRACLWDRRAGIIPIDPDALGRGAFLLRAPALLDLVGTLLDRYWSTAEPLRHRPGANVSAEVRLRQRQVLLLLAEGLTDAAIGRRIGVGTRTVARDVEALREQLGARNRFQMGVAAVRRGLLPGGPPVGGPPGGGRTPDSRD